MSSASGAITRRRVLRVDAEVTAVEDALALEAPLEIRCGGAPLTSVMRTPGHDVELVRGLLFAEGVLRSAGDCAVVREAERGELRGDEVGNVVDVDLDPELVQSRWPSRSLYISSACGVCGATAVGDVASRAAVNRSNLRVPASVVSSLPDRLRGAQEIFEATGGLHAAGVFSAAGEIIAVREDVGRHSAVDKLVGWALAEGMLPLADSLLCVSGRLSFELVHKAVMAGVPILCAVSAPSSLAVDLAEQLRVTLCGFVRNGRFNLYSHPARIEA